MGDAVLRLGVSGCLLGQEVRWNAGHKRDRYLTDTLGPRTEWVPLCPEADVGMGVPRPTVRLEGPKDDLRMVAPKTGEDWTERMVAWCRDAVAALPEIDGFLLKKGSPSCGPLAKRYDPNPTLDQPGLFAAELLRQRPWLAVLDEGRLHADPLRWGFLDHAFWVRRWREADVAPGVSLMTFHRDHKLTYRSHDPAGARELGRLAADGDVAAYRDRAAEVMRQVPTVGRHVDTLQHAAGYLKRDVDGADRQELAEAIDDYRLGVMPLLVPLTLLRHHVRRAPVPDWLAGQTYLQPYPKEWTLRG
ncbi:MAG: YbgA family protein [Thermoplasmatota archaeon]